MSSINVLVPMDSLSLTKQENFRLNALAAGFVRAHEKRVASIAPEEIPGFDSMETPQKVATVKSRLLTGWTPKSIDCHELRNNANDLAVGPAVDAWRTAPLAAVGTLYSCFQAINPATPANKIHVYWMISVELPLPPPVSRLQINSQVGGNIIGIYDLEQLYTRENTVGFLSEPVVIDPSTTYQVQVLARFATGAFANVALGAYVFEPAGLTVR